MYIIVYIRTLVLFYRPQYKIMALNFSDINKAELVRYKQAIKMPFTSCYWIFYWLTDWVSSCSWLMPKDRCDSITTKAMSLIFSLFNVTNGTPQYVHYILMGLPVCVSFIFAESKMCWFGGCKWHPSFLSCFSNIFWLMYCLATGWT